MSDNKPTSLREIYKRCDVSNNGTENPLSFEEFVAAITALVPEKQSLEGVSNLHERRRILHRNQAIDTIKQNFSGQTDNEREDSQI